MVHQAERLPTESVLTEADIVSQPLPPLSPPTPATAEGKKEGEAKTENKEEDKAKGPQLSVEEVKVSLSPRKTLIHPPHHLVRQSFMYANLVLSS